MKLYTEEQMRQCYEGVLQNVGTSIKQSDLPKVDEYINSLTPIELPSDEEIENRIKTHNPYPKQKQMHIDWSNGFERGAKWVIDKIKNQQQ